MFMPRAGIAGACLEALGRVPDCCGIRLLRAPPVCHDGGFVNTGDATWLVEQ